MHLCDSSNAFGFNSFIARTETVRDRYRISYNGLGLLDLCKQSAAQARYVSLYEKLLGHEKQLAEYAVAAAEEVCGTHQEILHT